MGARGERRWPLRSHEPCHQSPANAMSGAADLAQLMRLRQQRQTYYLPYLSTKAEGARIGIRSMVLELRFAPSSLADMASAMRCAASTVPHTGLTLLKLADRSFGNTWYFHLFS